MTFAVIKTGGKQYKVSVGEIINVEKINTSPKLDTKDKTLKKETKNTIEFIDLLNGKKVIAEIGEIVKGPKIKILKFKNKTRYTKRMGHRQKYTQIKIVKIS